MAAVGSDRTAAPDTIAAIATGAGGGVGIIRISGPHAEAICRALVPSLPRNLMSHRLLLGTAIDPGSGERLDEVLAVVMRAPRSYTGEDVAELHGHGGAANLGRLLHAAIAQGARLATPGEFTRRAFEAGKLDLSQAEAIALVIGARDERGLRAAHALRRGALGERVDGARREIVASLADLEGALDFPDDTTEVPAPETAPRRERSAAGPRASLDPGESVLPDLEQLHGGLHVAQAVFGDLAVAAFGEQVVHVEPGDALGLG